MARTVKIALAVLAAAVVTACAPMQRQRQYAWVPSPNFDQRRPNFIVVHHTQNDTLEQALSTLTSAAREVSSHYLIARDGRVLQLVDDLGRAWHAGRSWWGGHTDINSTSIGIELDNNGFEPFAEPQIVALEKLLRELVDRLRIPPQNVVGHGDVAPGRKVDPSRYFPWQRLAQSGFGLWCAQAGNAARPGLPGQSGQSGQPGQPVSSAAPAIASSIDPILAMMAIGYDVSRPEVARAAFRRHFLGIDSDADWSAGDLEQLACLVQTVTDKARGL